jgi:hypothetical protein
MLPSSSVDRTNLVLLETCILLVPLPWSRMARFR